MLTPQYQRGRTYSKARLIGRLREVDVVSQCIPRLLAFAEAIGDESMQSCHRRLFIGTLGFDRDRGAFGRREHHHAHNAFRVYASTITLDPDVAFKLAGELRQLGRRSRVQAELVDDFSFPLQHCARSR
jgi:hypothetical protein